MTQAFALRQLADYEAQADLDAVEVRRLIEEGRSFLDTAREYLTTPRESDPSASDR